MTETNSTVKKNALMQLFYKRQPEKLPTAKPVKKVKLAEDKEDDPLYKVLSWRDQYKEYTFPPQNTFKVIKQTSLQKADQTNWTQDVQGVFINIDWDRTPMEQLKELNLSEKLIHNGIVFIWGNKSNIGQMMDYFQKMNFMYVENFIFVLLNRQKIPKKSQKTIKGNSSLLNFVKFDTKNEDKQNKSQNSLEKKDYQTGKINQVQTIFCNQDSTYFKQTQKVLYMFRKVAKNEPLQLRHQRTSDVFFTIGDSLKLDWKSKEMVYKMIETLLINANYKSNQRLKLVQLWGDATKPRKGWVTVAEANDQNSKCQEPQNQSQKEIKPV